MFFVNQTIKILQNPKYYIEPDTVTTCCTCIRFNKFKARKKKMVARANPRDAARLNDWKEFNTYYGNEAPPVFEHIIVDNSKDLGKNNL